MGSVPRGSGTTGKNARSLRFVWHATPVVPKPHTYPALLVYISRKFGIILPTMFTQDELDRTVGRVLGSYVLLELREKGARL